MRLISTGHLAAAVGVPLALLSQWLKRGVVRASGERERVGMPRGWTIDEAITLALFIERSRGNQLAAEAAEEAVGMAAGTIAILNAPSGPSDAAAHVLYIIARWPDGHRDARVSFNLDEALRIAASGIEAGARVEVIDTLPTALRVLNAFKEHGYDGKVAVTGANLARQAGEQVLAGWRDGPVAGSA